MAKKKDKITVVGKLPDGSDERRRYSDLVRQYEAAFKELYDNHTRKPKPRLGLHMFRIQRPDGVLRLTPSVEHMRGGSREYMNPKGIQTRVKGHLETCLDQIGLDDLVNDMDVECNGLSSVCEIKPKTYEARAYLSLYSKKILVPEMARYS